MRNIKYECLASSQAREGRSKRILNIVLGIVLCCCLSVISTYTSAANKRVNGSQRALLQEIPLVPIGIGQDDTLGESISVGRNQLMIGAPGDDDLGIDSGAVYVYEFIGSSWVQISKLTAPGGLAGDRFGDSVEIVGTRAIIGASRGDGLVADSGTAYIYDFNGANWQFTQILMADDGAADDRFGISVSVEGDRALIGASSDDNLGGQSGSAYIFELDQGSWSQVTRLNASDGGAIAEFGLDVSLLGDRALIGAPGDDEIAIVAGAAYVFELVTGAWTESAKLLASDGAFGDGLGVSVSLAGDRAVAGAPGNGGTGAVYVYDFDGNNWQQSQRVSPMDLTGADLFGDSLELKGDTFIAGAPGATGSVILSGAAYRYEFDGSNWALVEKLQASNGAQQDQFGSAVSLFVGRFAVGANFADRVGMESGAAYVYQEGTDLQLTVMAPSQAVAGTDYTYDLLITNNGPLPAIRTQFTHSLNPVLPVTASMPCQAGFPCDLGDLAVGENIHLQLSAPIPLDASGLLQLQAQLSADSVEVVPGNESGNRKIAIVQQADLNVTQTGPLIASAGELLMYEVTISNQGPSRAADVILDDAVSAGLAFVGADAPCAAGFPCLLGDLDPGQSIQLTVTHQAMLGFSGTVTHTSSVSSNATDPMMANNTSSMNTAVDVVVDLAVNLTAPATAIAGDTIQFQYMVSSTSINDAPGATLAHTLPAGVTFVSATSPCESGFPCDLGTVAAMGNLVVDAVFQLDSDFTGSLDTTATISTLVDDNNAANDSSPSSTMVLAEADIAIQLSNLEPAVAGTTFTLSVDVDNSGPSDAQGLMLANPLLSGASFISATTPCESGFPCNLGALASGQNIVIEVQLSIDADYVGMIDTQFDVNAATNDTNPANNSQLLSQAAQVVHDLAIVKRSFVAHIDLDGFQHFYELEVRNLGPSRAIGARITDAIPALLTNPNWDCQATLGDCPVPNNGVGDVDVLVNVDVGGEVLISIFTDIDNLLEGDEVYNEAQVSAAAGSSDPNSQNNREDDLDVVALFADGLESDI